MSDFLDPTFRPDAESTRESRALARGNRDSAPGKQTPTSALTRNERVTNYDLTRGVTAPPEQQGVKTWERKGSTRDAKSPDGNTGEVVVRKEFDKKQDVFDPKRVPKAVKKGADLATEAAMPDYKYAEYESEHSATLAKGSTDFGDENGLQGRATGKLLDGSVKADGVVELKDGKLHVGGNAGAWATVAGGSVVLTIPDKTFTLLGEKVSARFDFDLAADAFAGGDASVDANVGLTGAGLEAKLSGFAGAKAIASAGGELRWLRRPTQDYAKRIANNGLFQKTFGHVLPAWAVDVGSAAVEPFIEMFIDRMLSSAEQAPLVLGVTASGEASAGIGGSAGFSAGFRGGVLYCKGHAGLTLGLGAGYRADLALGVRDGMAMVALMALTGTGFLGDDLKPERSWTDYVSDAIRNYITDGSLASFAVERSKYLYKKVTEFGNEDGVHGKVDVRGGGLTVYADGRIVVDQEGLHVGGRAGAEALLAGAEVEIRIPEKSFTVLGEQLLGGAIFRVGAKAYARAEGKLNADVDTSGAEMQVNLSGFAGAKAIASAEGTLKWARRTNDEYAKRIVEHGMFLREFGNLGWVGRAIQLGLEPQVKRLLDRILTGADMLPLVLGVSVTGEAAAGVGGSASFHASMRRGRIKVSASAGLTLGLGGDVKYDVEIGALDALTMLAIMALTHADDLGNLKVLESGKTWRDFMREQIHGETDAERERAATPESGAGGDGRGIGTRVLEYITGDRQSTSETTSEGVPAAATPESAAGQQAAEPVVSGTYIEGDIQPGDASRAKARKRSKPRQREADGPPTMLGPAPESARAPVGYSKADRKALDDLVERSTETAPARRESQATKRRRTEPAIEQRHSSEETGGMTKEQYDAVVKLGEVVADGEGSYNSYNTGTRRSTKTGNLYVVHSGIKNDLTSMTVDEILATRSLPPENWNRVFAAGKYQVVLDTLQVAKSEMPLTGNEVFTPELQERIFFEYLIGKKRSGIDGYIRRGEGTSDDATYLAAKEWASIEVPAGRRIADYPKGVARYSNGRMSYYESGANHAKRGSGAKIKAALENARAAFAGIQNGEVPDFKRLPVEDDPNAVPVATAADVAGDASADS